jgi:hypothetical protein
MYAAEAYCALGRAQEAADVLSSVPTTGKATLEELQLDGIQHEELSASEAAQVARLVNESVVQAMLGNLDDARMPLEEALDVCPTHKQALRCMVYILLRQAKTSEALRILKHERYTYS